MPNELYFNGAMPNPYDLALRERAVTAYERGEGSYAQLAALFDVDHRTLERWVARWRDTHSVAPHRRGRWLLTYAGLCMAENRSELP